MPFANLRWYPADIRGKRYPDVPMQIAAAASEAHRCIAVEVYRGAVLLARSVIEATAKHKGITTGSLMHKIDAMHRARLIRDDVRDGAHEVRYLGNDMAHGDYDEPVPQADAELVVSLMDEVLEEICQAPARVRGGEQPASRRSPETVMHTCPRLPNETPASPAFRPTLGFGTKRPYPHEPDGDDASDRIVNLHCETWRGPAATGAVLA
jgi:hypothetical protein